MADDITRLQYLDAIASVLEVEAGITPDRSEITEEAYLNRIRAAIEGIEFGGAGADRPHRPSRTSRTWTTT